MTEFTASKVDSLCVHSNQSTDEKQYHRALCVTMAQVEPVLKTLFMGKTVFQKQL